MPEGTRWVGLDVHAAQTACAVFDRTRTARHPASHGYTSTAPPRCSRTPATSATPAWAKAARIDPQQLARTTQWYLRPEALAAANALIVNAHHALPLTQEWGDGRFSREHVNPLGTYDFSTDRPVGELRPLRAASAAA